MEEEKDNKGNERENTRQISQRNKQRSQAKTTTKEKQTLRISLDCRENVGLQLGGPALLLLEEEEEEDGADGRFVPANGSGTAHSAVFLLQLTERALLLLLLMSMMVGVVVLDPAWRRTGSFLAARTSASAARKSAICNSCMGISFTSCELILRK